MLHFQWSQSFQAMIKRCLQKSPTQRPKCDELLQHEHFKPLSDEQLRNEYRNKIVVEILDQIENVGTTSKRAEERG
jgi:serine/threonine protein kinase